MFTTRRVLAARTARCCRRHVQLSGVCHQTYRRLLSSSSMSEVERLKNLAHEMHPKPVKFKTAQEYIESVAPIEVDGPIARCDGGDGPLGHPTEFIQLNKVHSEPETCKYCGLRFVRKDHHH